MINSDNTVWYGAKQGDPNHITGRRAVVVSSHLLWSQVALHPGQGGIKGALAPASGRGMQYCAFGGVTAPLARIKHEVFNLGEQEKQWRITHRMYLPE